MRRGGSTTPRRRLAELAAELGSDVPFFLAGGPAICRGRGERVEPVARSAAAATWWSSSRRSAFRRRRRFSALERRPVSAARGTRFAAATGQLLSITCDGASSPRPAAQMVNRLQGRRRAAVPVDRAARERSWLGCACLGHTDDRQRLGVFWPSCGRPARRGGSPRQLSSLEPGNRVCHRDLSRSEPSVVRRTAVEITEVRIKLMDEPGERLKAFCSITFDNCFVVRDLKIIEGPDRAVRRDAQPQAHGPLPAVRHEESLARAVLQPMRQRAVAGSHAARRRRPREAVRRHRASDQLVVPRNDSRMRRPRIRGGARTRRSSRTTCRGTTTSTWTTATFRQRPQPASASETRDRSAARTARQPCANHRPGGGAKRRGRAARRRRRQNRSTPRRRTDPPFDGFGAGIFPEE